MYKNREKSPRKIGRNLIEEIENDYLADYYDYNFTQYYEEKGYTYNISYDLMFKSFYEDDIVSPLAQRNTIKLYNEKMNNAIKLDTATKKQETLYKDFSFVPLFRKKCFQSLN